MSDEAAPKIMIEVVDLHKRFKDLHVLKGISTKITKGEVVAVRGFLFTYRDDRKEMVTWLTNGKWMPVTLGSITPYSPSAAGSLSSV